MRLDWAVADARDRDPIRQPIEARLVDDPARPGPVAAHQAVRGQLQLARQLAVVGEQEQALRVEVEPPDRDQTR
jgi:hypothetical protein